VATLNLPTDPRTAVWRLIVARLQADPALSAAIRTWLVWDGSGDDNTDITAARGPALRLYPVPEPMTWFDESSQTGGLTVAVDAGIPGHDAEDVLNLQGAIESALYPPGAAGDLWRAQLVAAGAVNGTFVFVHPLAQAPVQPPPATAAGSLGALHPLGSFRIDVLRNLIN